MKDKNWIWVLIIVAVVVGIVASLITANFTGNALRSLTVPNAGGEITNVTVTYQGVLNMLNSCSFVEPSVQYNNWCAATCEAQGKKTIGAYTDVKYVAIKQDSQKDLQMLSYFRWGNDQPLSSCGPIGGCGGNTANELTELELLANTTTVDIANVPIEVVSRCICCSPA